jgi:hypothetical protein
VACERAESQLCAQNSSSGALTDDLEFCTLPSGVPRSRALAEAELILVGSDLGRDLKGDLKLEEAADCRSESVSFSLSSSIVVSDSPVLLIPLDLGVKANQAERIGLSNGSDRVE